MKVQEGFLQFRDQFVEDIPIPMEIDQTEEIKIEEFKTREIKDEMNNVEETEKMGIKTETLIKKEDVKMEIKTEEFKTREIKDEMNKLEETEKMEIKTETLIKKEDIKMEEIKAEVTTTKKLRMVRRSGRRSMGNTTL